MLRTVSAHRGGVVELAIILPLVAFLFVIAVDYARIFYYSLTVANCARNGALHLSDPFATVNSPYGNVTGNGDSDGPAPRTSATSSRSRRRQLLRRLGRGHDGPLSDHSPGGVGVVHLRRAETCLPRTGAPGQTEAGKQPVR
jgi:TadE-like protein